MRPIYWRRDSKMRREFRSSAVPPSLKRCYFMKPRLAIALLLFCCWSSQSGFTSANAKHHFPKNLRLRVPNHLAQEMTAADDSAGHPPLQSDETEFMGPFGGIGNIEPVEETTRRKKNCGISTIAARSIVGPSLKRDYFANTREEVEEKIQEEKRRKRDVDDQQGMKMKRNDLSDGPLPWACLTMYDWEDMGVDHYPRFVRTAECKSRVCFNGFFRCKPRRYKTKVLKRITGTEAASCETEDDVSLPASLRNSWRFITVTINLCCDCTGRIPGTDV